MRSESANPETPDEIIAMITFAGSPELQEQLRSLCREYFDIFSTSVRSVPAQVDPMVIEIDRTKWEVPRNNLPPRHPHADQQTVEARRHRGIAGQRVEPSSPLPKGDGQWRLTLDFVPFSAATKGLEGWRLGTMTPTCFGLLDFTVGYHQTPRLHYKLIVALLALVNLLLLMYRTTQYASLHPCKYEDSRQRK